MAERPTVYPGKYEGPTDADIEGAQAVFDARIAAEEHAKARSIILCNACDTPFNVTRWIAIDDFETCFGPYERDVVLRYTVIKCPACGDEHPFGYTHLTEEPLLNLMERKKRIDGELQ